VTDYRCSIGLVSTRQQLVLDAAIEVLGNRGMRNLTHRAVDDRAGLPMGSTSNLFRTREALIAGVLGRLQERERAGWLNLISSPSNAGDGQRGQETGPAVPGPAGSPARLDPERDPARADAGGIPDRPAAGPPDQVTIVAALGRFVRHLTGEGRVLTLARHAIFVEASHNPALQAQIARARQELAAWAAPFVAALGSRSPEADLMTLLSFVDGLLINQLACPADDFDPTPAIAAFLRGMAF
jgi:AcrR family transcriptional regulator